MKKLLIPFACILLLISSYIHAQDKVTSSRLAGDWKLVIDIDEAFDKAQNELDEDEEIMGSLLLSSVSGLVNGILDNINIFFEFEKSGEVMVTVDAFGDTETETANWKIDNKGKLYIDSEDSFQIEKDSYWVFKNDILVNYDDEGEPNNIYLVRIQ